MMYIDTSVLPSLADTFRHCGELVSVIKRDLINYMYDASKKFHEQVIVLAERTDKAARQLKNATERQKSATATRELAIGHYETSVHNLGVIKSNLKRARREGEWYEGEREDIKQQIRDQKDTIEANEQNMNYAIADFEQAEIALQNAQTTYDDAKFRLEEAKRIIGEFDSLYSQFGAVLTAPKKNVTINLPSEVYRFSVSQDYSIKTMLDHLSKDYIDKVVAALEGVQQKIDAILSIGQQHFGCHITPTRAVVSSTGGVGGGPYKKIGGSQTGNETFCQKCGQLKAICRCNEIIEKTIKSYNRMRLKIQKLQQEAADLKAKIDQLQPFENTYDSLDQNMYDEIERINTEKKNLLNEYSTRELNIDNYWKDGKRALVQAAWEREKDDEKVYRSAEMDALWNKVDGMHRENRLLEDRANQLDDLMEKKRFQAMDAMHEAREAQKLEETRLGGSLEDFKNKYKFVLSRLKGNRERLKQCRKKLRNYGVKIDKNGNIITNQ